MPRHTKECLAIPYHCVCGAIDHAPDMDNPYVENPVITDLKDRIAELEAKLGLMQSLFNLAIDRAETAETRVAELETFLQGLADATDPTGPMADAAVHDTIIQQFN